MLDKFFKYIFLTGIFFTFFVTSQTCSRPITHNRVLYQTDIVVVHFDLSKDTLRKNEGNGEVRRCYKCGQQGHEQSQCIRKPTLDDTTYAKSMKNPK
jgi:hypothetical protein